MSPDTTTHALQEYVGQHLPLTGAMGIAIVSASGQRVELTAPLAPNINHEKTAFGGSISALGLLAAWSLLWCRLYEEAIDPMPRLVVSHSETRYIRPIAGELFCVCETADLAPCVAEFHRAGRIKQSLRAEIFDRSGSSRVAAVVDALFVASRLEPSS